MRGYTGAHDPRPHPLLRRHPTSFSSPFHQPHLHPFSPFSISDKLSTISNPPTILPSIFHNQTKQRSLLISTNRHGQSRQSVPPNIQRLTPYSLQSSTPRLTEPHLPYRCSIGNRKHSRESGRWRHRHGTSINHTHPTQNQPRKNID